MRHTTRLIPLLAFVTFGLACTLSPINPPTPGSILSDTPTPHDTPIPSDTQMPPGFIGEHPIGGHVFGLSAQTPVPLAGAVVSYTRFSYILPYTQGLTLTLADGSYAFAPILLRDTDSIDVFVQAEGYAPQQTKRGGVELLSNPAFDFTLAPLTPTPSP